MSIKKQRMIKLQFSGRSLKNLDVFSKSDPFLIISRRNASQVLTQVRRTETKDNNLNPDWSVLYMSLNELCESDFNMKLQIDVKDDDGATSELIGSVEVTLADLEAAYCNHTSVQLLKKNKPRGEILVRNCTIDPPSFQEMVSSDIPGKDTADFKSSNYGYLPQNPSQGPGYPPSQTQGYPPAHVPGYPPAQGPGYPPAQG
ncbi:copine-3, partial [Eurytemora carolleeae]|uniref:copine-3 n=1 Tax=Eurytemora carolleeae TaxID=1294199 RepID=UPI000C76E259